MSHGDGPLCSKCGHFIRVSRPLLIRRLVEGPLLDSAGNPRAPTINDYYWRQTGERVFVAPGAELIPFRQGRPVVLVTPTPRRTPGSVVGLLRRVKAAR